MKSLRTHPWSLALCTALTLSAPVGAQTIDNKGTEFLVSFQPLVLAPHTPELHLTADAPASVRVTYPVNSPTFDSTVSVVPGAITVVTLPVVAATSWNPDIIQNNAVHVSATAEIVAYAVTSTDGSAASALILPVESLDTRYHAVTYGTSSADSQFTITAAFDGTRVTVTPYTPLVGRNALAPFTITLNRGQAYYNRSRNNSNDTTGSLIQSSKPIAVSSGNQCELVPGGVPFCDHLFEIPPPVQQWGTEVAVANLPGRTAGSIYRVIPSISGSTITMDGVPISAFNGVGFPVETPALTGNHIFRGDRPFLIEQYMTSARAEGPAAILGDPSMGTITPVAQFRRQHHFMTVNATGVTEHFVTIIADNSDVGTLLLDGVPVPAQSFTPVPTSNLSAAVVRITPGTHVTSSTQPHGVTAEGLGNFVSYLHPAAAGTEPVNPLSDTNRPVCTRTNFVGGVRFTGSDDRPTEDINGNGVLDTGEDLNGNELIDVDSGLFGAFVVNPINMRFVGTPLVPGSPATSFEVRLTEPSQRGFASVIIADDAGNECGFELNVAPDPNAPPPPPPPPPPLACDVDLDRNVDRLDIAAITAARNQPAANAEDPRDADHNGTINVLDARLCTQLCTQAACAIL
jgi:hypothetical protein